MYGPMTVPAGGAARGVIVPEVDTEAKGKSGVTYLNWVEDRKALTTCRPLSPPPPVSRGKRSTSPNLVPVPAPPTTVTLLLAGTKTAPEKARALASGPTIGLASVLADQVLATGS